MTFKSLVTAIADAIREKGGTTEKIRGRDIPEAIRNMKTGISSDSYILYNAFDSNGYITDITLHGDIEKISDAARGRILFQKTKTVNFEKVNKIPGQTLSSDKTSFYFLDDDIKEFGEKVFDRCSVAAFRPYGYSYNAIPETVTEIPNYFCYESVTMTNGLYLHDGITKIGNNAFASGGVAINNGELPSSLEHLGQYALYGNRIPFTKIPASVKIIEDNAFNYNDVISSVTFLGTPESIGNGVFANCTNLKNIYVPWAQGAVANAPWGATNATIHYNTAV